MNKYFDHISALLKAKSPLYLRVKLIPKSPVNEIVEIMDDETYKIRIKAVPENGKANSELIKYLKKELKATEVKIISGGRVRVKLIKIVK